MMEACEKVNALNFIYMLPKRLDTIVGEKGICLSEGQKQRLLIARLLLQNPDLIIFDEATSALDYENEREIVDLLFQNLKEKTLVVVTHRKTLLNKYNRIINLDKEKYSVE